MGQVWQFDFEVTDRQTWPSIWGRITLLGEDFPTYRDAFLAAHNVVYMNRDVAMVTALECVTWPDKED